MAILVSKYTDPEGAEKILENGTLIWRSPLEVNDPFDVQWDPDWILRTPESKIQLETAIRTMICGPYDWTRVKDPRNRKWLSKIRIEAAEDPKSVEPAVATALAELTSHGRASHSRQILERFLSQVRILCLSRNPNSILMWSHYSKGHAGIRLDFDLEILRRSMPCDAIQVEYAENLPVVQSLESWIDVLMYDEGLEVAPDFAVQLLRLKWRDWSYEQEIRLNKKGPGSLGKLHDIYAFDRSALKAVAIGCRASKRLEESVCRSVRSNYSEVMVSKTTPAPITFRLDENRIQ